MTEDMFDMTMRLWAATFFWFILIIAIIGISVGSYRIIKD